jgi:molybdopterin adenylyltransferase
MTTLPHPDSASQTTVICAVITVSDTRTPDTDKSGQLMQSHLIAAGHSIAHYQIIQDEPAQITALIQQLASQPTIQAILLNGGTGIAPRDTTYEAIAHLLTKEIPGFGEIFRQLSYQEIGSRAISSRAIAGICTAPASPSNPSNNKHTLIFSVPGSSKAVALAMQALILPELRHLTSLLK